MAAVPALRKPARRARTGFDPTDKLTKSATTGAAPAKGAQTFESMLGVTATIRRGPGPEGTKRLLTRHQIGRLRAWFDAAPEPTRTEVAALSNSLASPVARGLLLKMVVSQIGKLDLPALTTFAEDLAQHDDQSLLERATVLDLDSRTNSNPRDPTVLSERRGVIYEPGLNDEEGNNDGLFQRFSASCGPTVLQMLICEADPAIAFEVHDAGLFSDSARDGPASFQRELLEQYGGVALGRRDWQIRSRLRNASGRLVASKQISGAELTSFRRYVEAAGPRTKAAARALALLRSQFAGLPTATELRRLRRAGPMPERDEGIDTASFLDALNKHATPKTGLTYRSTSPDYGFARGQVWRHVDAIERTLRQGIDVPFGVSEPGHWMLMTHVKGKKPNRAFLVSDPEGGRTAWVRERDFIKGTFVDAQFHLCSGEERGYVDCVIFGAEDGRTETRPGAGPNAK